VKAFRIFIILFLAISLTALLVGWMSADAPLVARVHFVPGTTPAQAAAALAQYELVQAPSQFLWSEQVSDIERRQRSSAHRLAARL
jgi:hypothetical protein